MAEPYYRDEDVTLHLGDCLDVLAAMDPGSIDAIVTDPPYGLEFMGREWDGANGFRRSLNAADAGRDSVFGRASRTSPEYVAGPLFQRWCEAWAAECLRVLKPGGHLLAFGGTRTYHRMACAIEDAGFEIRDSLHWLYGSGFPKNGACLKPAHEPIVMARTSSRRSEPLPGLDACRVEASAGDYDHPSNDLGKRDDETSWRFEARKVPPNRAGRWPANIVLTHSAACEATGTRRVRGGSKPSRQETPRDAGDWGFAGRSIQDYADADGMETVEAWECAPDCPVAGLDRQSGILYTHGGGTRTGARASNGWGMGEQPDVTPGFPSQGGASRFFPVFRYAAKAPASERPRLPDGTAWPTVKPLDLMRWLVRLVTPPGGTVLDLFAGTGTTGEACIVEGFRCILIERDPAAVQLTMERLRKPIQPVMFGLNA